MLGLIQRVSSAAVTVQGETLGSIGSGILLLLGVQKHDTETEAEKLTHRVLSYRIFPDEKGHMNLSLKDVGGDLLVVSQFTLAADTHKGLRPSFSSAAAPEMAEQLYEYFLECARRDCSGTVSSGSFGADMQVQLTNDGPVTFLLNV